MHKSPEELRTSDASQCFQHSLWVQSRSMMEHGTRTSWRAKGSGLVFGGARHGDWDLVVGNPERDLRGPRRCQSRRNLAVEHEKLRRYVRTWYGEEIVDRMASSPECQYRT